MKTKPSLLAALCGLSLTLGPAFAADTAYAIYHNGSILTMARREPSYVEALAVKDGKIAFAGDKTKALEMKGGATQVVDLGGKALLPGFLDAHSHFINALSVAGQANCYAAPFGPGGTKQGILDSIRKLITDKKIPAG